MNTRDFLKDPSDRMDYGIDWDDWLDTDTIAASAWTLTTGITSYAESNDATGTTIWLTGGTHGRDYLATNQITTAGGRIKQLSLTVKVRED